MSCCARLTRRKPDVAVLIDFPDFNFRLARELYRRGIPVVYFVSPQLWAWRQGRIKLVQKYVKKMLVIFPFEEKFYRDRGVSVEYVGHPLADVADDDSLAGGIRRANGLDHGEAMDRAAARQQQDRRSSAICQTMLEACMQLAASEFEFILPVASTLTTGLDSRPRSTDAGISCLVQTRPPPHPRPRLRRRQRHSDGRSCAGRQSVRRGLSPLVTHIHLRTPLVSVPHYAMANLIAEKRAVPELIQDDFTAENIVKHLRELIPDGPRPLADDG